MPKHTLVEKRNKKKFIRNFFLVYVPSFRFQYLSIFFFLITEVEASVCEILVLKNKKIYNI
jgi:hypothetical protein